MGRAWCSSAKGFRPPHSATSPITYKRHLARVMETFSSLGLPWRRAQHQKDNRSLFALKGVHGAAVNPVDP